MPEIQPEKPPVHPITAAELEAALQKARALNPGPAQATAEFLKQAERRKAEQQRQEHRRVAKAVKAGVLGRQDLREAPSGPLSRFMADQLQQMRQVPGELQGTNPAALARVLKAKWDSNRHVSGWHHAQADYFEGVLSQLQRDGEARRQIFQIKPPRRTPSAVSRPWSGRQVREEQAAASAANNQQERRRRWALFKLRRTPKAAAPRPVPEAPVEQPKESEPLPVTRPWPRRPFILLAATGAALAIAGLAMRQRLLVATGIAGIGIGVLGLSQTWTGRGVDLTVLGSRGLVSYWREAWGSPGLAHSLPVLGRVLLGIPGLVPAFILSWLALSFVNVVWASQAQHTPLGTYWWYAAAAITSAVLNMLAAILNAILYGVSTVFKVVIVALFELVTQILAASLGGLYAAVNKLIAVTHLGSGTLGPPRLNTQAITTGAWFRLNYWEPAANSSCGGGFVHIIECRPLAEAVNPLTQPGQSVLEPSPRIQWASWDWVKSTWDSLWQVATGIGERAENAWTWLTGGS